MQLKDSVCGAAASGAWYQIRKKIGDLRPSLPNGLIGPFFNDEYGDVFSAIYLLTGEGRTRADLKTYAEALQKRLQRVDDAAKVALIGDVKEKIPVEISPTRLATLGLSPQVIFDAIAKQNAMTAAGACSTSADAVQVRVSGALGSLQALRNLPITSGGQVFRLGDTATLSRDYEDPPAYLAFLNGTESVGVTMADGTKVAHLDEALKAEVEAFKVDLPLGVEVSHVSVQADIVSNAFEEFIHTVVEALVIVLAVSFVTLGLRTGIVVALSVPIVLAAVFTIMPAMGLNFDRITLGALINASLRSRWLVIGLTIAALLGAGLGMGFVQRQFFPTSARPELFIESRMPEGSAIEATAKAALAAEALVKGDPDVRYASTCVGAGSPRFFFAMNPALPNPSFGLTVVMAKAAAARDRLRAKIEAAVATSTVPQARIRVDQIDFGPPVGFPVQFRVIGPDPVQVRQIAEQVRHVMDANPHTIEPQFNWNEQAKTVRLALDQDRIRALGLSTQDVSNTLQALLSGVTVTQDREGTKLIDVVVRAPAADRSNPEGLGDLTLLLPNGAAVPLTRIARIRYGSEEPILWRSSRDMALTVRADIVPGVQAPGVSAKIEPLLAPIIKARPASYRVETDGAVEESAKANVALFKVFPQKRRDADASDVAAEEPFQAVSAVGHRPTWPDRRGGCAVALQRAVRVRSTVGGHRACGHDHAQHGHSGGSDRPRSGGRRIALGCHRGKHGKARKASGSDDAGGNPRDDPAGAVGVLAAAGFVDHGRVDRGHRADPVLPAGALGRVVPGAPNLNRGRGTPHGARDLPSRSVWRKNDSAQSADAHQRRRKGGCRSHAIDDGQAMRRPQRCGEIGHSGTTEHNRPDTVFGHRVSDLGRNPGAGVRAVPLQLRHRHVRGAHFAAMRGQAIVADVSGNHRHGNRKSGDDGIGAAQEHRRMERRLTNARNRNAHGRTCLCQASVVKAGDDRGIRTVFGGFDPLRQEVGHGGSPILGALERGQRAVTSDGQNLGLGRGILGSGGNLFSHRDGRVRVDHRNPHQTMPLPASEP